MTIKGKCTYTQMQLYTRNMFWCGANRFLWGPRILVVSRNPGGLNTTLNETLHQAFLSHLHDNSLCKPSYRTCTTTVTEPKQCGVARALRAVLLGKERLNTVDGAVSY